MVKRLCWVDCLRGHPRWQHVCICPLPSSPLSLSFLYSTCCQFWPPTCSGHCCTPNTPAIACTRVYNKCNYWQSFPCNSIAFRRSLSATILYFFANNVFCKGFKSLAECLIPRHVRWSLGLYEIKHPFVI